MNKKILFCIVLLFLQLNLFYCGVFAEPQTDNTDYLSFQTEDEKNNIEIFKEASVSVVYITNKELRRDFFSFNVYEIPQGTGSGFIWNKDGIIITNFHVVRGADKITVTLNDKSSWDAEIIGLAPEKDLAALRIKAPMDKLIPLPVGDSALLEVGRKVLAIGNPFGLDTTLTIGVVSALGREIKSVANRTIHDVIQTDAAINPGNSGGPLLNSFGQLVGVNTAIYSPSGANVGIGFAIPVNAVKEIAPQLIKYGRLYRPVLGIEQLGDKWAKQLGIKGIPILRVTEGLPAAKAGMIGVRRSLRGSLVLGDVIIAIDHEPVSNNDDFMAILEKHKPGDTVKVITKRDDKTLEFKVTLAKP